MIYRIRGDDYLAHHGVLGMKWGVRKKEYRPKQTLKKRIKGKVSAIKSKRYDTMYNISAGSMAVSGAAFVGAVLTGPVGASAVMGAVSLASAGIGYKAYKLCRDGFWDD